MKRPRERTSTLRFIRFLAHYSQIFIVRCDLLLFLLDVFGNLFHQFGRVGLLPGRMGDLRFRGDELWSLFRTCKIPEVRS